MSKIEQLQRLRAEIAGDAQLVQKLGACKSPNELAEQIAVIAKERGYDVAVDDILSMITGNTDLTEKELAAVSGGANGPNTLQTQRECWGWLGPIVGC